MKGTQARIYQMKQRFIATIGREPNLLIVTPNEEMELNAARIKVNSTIMGMRVIVSDTIEQTVVGLVES